MTIFEKKIAQIEAYKDVCSRITWLIDEYESQIDTQTEAANNPDHWNYDGARAFIDATKVKIEVCNRLMSEMEKRI